MYLGQELACSVLEGAERAHCECHPMRSSIRVCPSSREMSDKCLRLTVRVPLLPRHGEDMDRGVEMLFLGYRIPRIALESSSALGNVCLCVWILTLEGMFGFRVCLGEEHHDESRCLGSTRVCSYSRGMRNKAFVPCGPVPPLPRHSFSPRGHCFDLRDPHTLSKRVLSDVTDTIGLLWRWIVSMESFQPWSCEIVGGAIFSSAVPL